MSDLEAKISRIFNNAKVEDVVIDEEFGCVTATVNNRKNVDCGFIENLQHEEDATTLFDDSLRKIRESGDVELVDAVICGKMSVRSARLIVDCRTLAGAGKRVEAIKKYRAETGVSLRVAQGVLDNKPSAA